MTSKRVEFYKNLPRKRISCGILIFNNKNKFLLLKAGNKSNYWGIPGGIIKKNESLITGLKREVLAGTGLKINVKKCVCIDYNNKKIANYTDDYMVFLFVGDKLSTNKIKQIKIDNKEVIDYKFVSFEEAIGLSGINTKRRLKFIKNNLRGDTVVIEKGKRII